MNQGDLVFVRGGLGYRPGLVEQMGKRKTQVSWADEKKEWIDNKRVVEAKDFIDKARLERLFKEEESMINHKGQE